MKDKNDKLYRPVSEPVQGQPEDCAELLHKYGTYEIQPTNDSDNTFPCISQGLPRKRGKKGDRTLKNDS
ncbi:MAG: hypothetical protein IJT03_04295 [Clostridia bacterium]|nr:hypothetical protein [Clostridia bacterium]